MKTLGASYLKFYSFEHRDHKVIWFSGELSLSRQEICYLRLQKLRNGTNLRISSKNKCVDPISETAPAQTNNEDKEMETIDSDYPKAVRVRFKLQKKCAYGEHFLVVGNDPNLGLWEPSSGLPLNWSEDHVWIGEVDLPSDKAVEYKFVLKAKTGTITWQTGPDRVIEAWDTDGVITIFEDWESPQLEKVVEEDPSSSNVDEEKSFEKLESVPPVVESNDGLSDSNGYMNHVETMDAENIEDDLEAQHLSLGDEASSGNNDNEEENDDDDDDDKVIMNGSDKLRSEGEPMLASDDKGVRVLVPDLVPEDIETVELDKVKEENTIETSSIISNDEKIELKDKNDLASASEHSIETDEVLIEEKQNHRNQNEQHEEDNKSEADMQWGRRTLQKFLANLGLQIVFLVEILNT